MVGASVVRLALRLWAVRLGVSLVFLLFLFRVNNNFVFVVSLLFLLDLVVSVGAVGVSAVDRAIIINKTKYENSCAN